MSHTGFDQTLKEFGRIGTNVRKSLVDEVLPEHFRIDYPNLVTFIEAYYEHLDSADNFGGVIQELQTIRDIEDTQLKYLDYMFDEIGLGVSQSSFTVPREAIRNFGNFFRVKGSEYSVYGFFRAFFNEEIEIIHPKDKLMRVGISNIGDEYRYRLQDGAIHQIFSTLIRSPIPLAEWEELYRRFVHPSGFHLGAQVVLEGLPQLTIGTAESVVDLRAHITNIYESVTLGLNAEGEVVGAVDGAPSRLAELYDGRDSDRINPNARLYARAGYLPAGYVNDDVPPLFRFRDRYSVYRNGNDFRNLSITTVSKYYSSIYEWAGFYQSFDDYADSANASAIRFSSTLDDFSARAYFRK